MDASSIDGLTELRDRVVCLDTGPDAISAYRGQLGTLATEALGFDKPCDLADQECLDSWCAEMAKQLSAQQGAAHVVAAGAAAYGAVVLAVRRPELVRSLLLGDPAPPADSADFTDVLRAVTAPTIVVAGVPDGVDEIPPAAQTFAGQVSNGVFVLIDGCEGRAHASRPESFNEWVSSFAGIAEGLAESAGLYDLEFELVDDPHRVATP